MNTGSETSDRFEKLHFNKTEQTRECIMHQFQRYFWSDTDIFDRQNTYTHQMKSSDSFKKHISSQSAEKLARKPGPFSERYYSMQEKRNNLAKTRPTSSNHFDRNPWSEKDKNLAMKLQSVFRQTSLTRKWTLGSTTSHCLGKIIWLDKKTENMMTLRAFPRESLTWNYMNLVLFFFDGFQTYRYCNTFCERFWEHVLLQP